MVRWSENHGGIGLQRGVREVYSKGGLGKTGQRGSTPVLFKRLCWVCFGGLGNRLGPRKIKGVWAVWFGLDWFWGL